MAGLLIGKQFEKFHKKLSCTPFFVLVFDLHKELLYTKPSPQPRQATNSSFTPGSLYTLRILNLYQKKQSLRYPQFHNAYANL